METEVLACLPDEQRRLSMPASIELLKGLCDKELYQMMPDSVKGCADTTLEAILNLQRGVAPPTSINDSDFYKHMVARSLRAGKVDTWLANHTSKYLKHKHRGWGLAMALLRHPVIARLPFFVTTDLAGEANNPKTLIGKDAIRHLFKVRITDKKGSVQMDHLPFFHGFNWVLTPDQQAALEQTTKELRALKAQLLPQGGRQKVSKSKKDSRKKSEPSSSSAPPKGIFD